MKYSIERQARESAYLQLYRELRQDIADGAVAARASAPTLPSAAGRGAGGDLDHGGARLRAAGGRGLCRGASAQRRICAPSAGAAPPAAREPGDHERAGRRPEDFPFPRSRGPCAACSTSRAGASSPARPTAGCLNCAGAGRGLSGTSRGLRFRPEQIVIGSGAEYLYGLVVQLLGRERVFALEEPCYEKIRRVYEANGAACETLPMGPDGIRSERFAPAGPVCCT